MVVTLRFTTSRIQAEAKYSHNCNKFFDWINFIKLVLGTSPETFFYKYFKHILRNWANCRDIMTRQSTASTGDGLTTGINITPWTSITPSTSVSFSISDLILQQILNSCTCKVLFLTSF
ncbi:hypothetical protein BsWGS_01914 [Bradybaena similaris]